MDMGNRLAIGILMAALAGASAVSAEPERIVSVVYGQTSLLAQADAQYAFSRARSVARTLDEGGVTSKTYSDKDLSEALTPPCKLAHLVYLESPSAKQIETIEKFIASGGKVIVHYSTSASFAKLMGMTAPKPTKSGAERWAGYRFGKKRPLHVPESMAAEAPTYWQVRPEAETSSVLANWEYASGKAGPPVVLKSAHGYWISRIMMDTGDASVRRRFLVSLSADCVPEVWRNAAKRQDVEIWKKIDASSLSDAKRRLRKASPESKKTALEKRLKALDGLEAEKQADFDKGLFGASMSKLWAMEEEALLAYAAVSGLGGDGGVVAVWERSPEGLFPGDWPKSADLMSRAGVTDVYIMTAELGISHVPVPGLAKWGGSNGGGGGIAEAVKACHARGIRVHAWIPALSTENMPEATRTEFIKQGRVLRDSRDGVVEWADPGHWRNREELARIAVWISNNTGMDGIHFDYVRYPHAECSLGSADRASFEKHLGRKVKNWPADVAVKGVDRRKYEEWRADRLNGMIEYVSGRIKKDAPGTAFSVAVYGKYPQCVASIGQNWALWLKKDWVDYAVPMNYSPDTGVVRMRLREQLAVADKNRIVCGIGVSSYEATLNAKSTIDQINTATEMGVKGFALYHSDKRFADEIAPALELAR